MARTKAIKDFDKYIEDIKKELNLLDVKVFWRKDTGIGDAIADWTNDNIIIKKNLPYNYTIFCIAHEMRHMYQVRVGLVTFNKKNEEYFSWNNYGLYTVPLTRIKNEDDWIAYNQLPWENDANMFARYFMRKQGLDCRY